MTPSSRYDKVHPPLVSTQKKCPPDSVELGNSTWTFLHTMAAYYPEKADKQTQADMTSFVTGLSKFYPCWYCADHLKEYLKAHPVTADSNVTLSRWFCDMHNDVNERLGKETFDCKKVMERWKDGPADGSCDL
eukprot:Clim_evm32s109 gene=Clim_evmTU32s109